MSELEQGQVRIEAVGSIQEHPKVWDLQKQNVELSEHEQKQMLSYFARSQNLIEIPARRIYREILRLLEKIGY